MSGPGARAVKPRLLVLASTYPRWPADPEPGFVHELAKRLTVDFEVIVLGPRAPGACRDEVLDGVRVHRYRYAPAALETLVNNGGIITNLKRQPWKWLLVPSFVLGLVSSLWRLNRQWRPDVIHAHWLLPQGLAVAALSRLGAALPPFLVTSHGADLFALSARPLKALKRFVFREAAAVTVVSGAMREELRQLGCPLDKVIVRPMGVDLVRRFTPDPTVERSRVEVLFVGRLVEKKGLRYLISAMPEVIAQHPGASLTVAGFGPEALERRAQAEMLGIGDAVDFIGPVSQADLPALYRRAAVFVAPFVQATSGDREGLGLVTVEALGCGCPAVVSDLPAVRQSIDSGWVTLVQPGDSGAIAAAITGMLTGTAVEERSAEVDGALLDRFDWDGVAAGYAELLTRVAARNCARSEDVPFR